MILAVEKSNLRGDVWIPSSKSHTIRAVALATLARGESTIINPLISEDTNSCVQACRALGAKIEVGRQWAVQGVAGEVAAPADVINVGNSGTTCRVAIGIASLGKGYSVFTGDASTRSRPMGPLLESLKELGAIAFSTKGDGKLPVVVGGALKGGSTRVDGITSQYVTSLLISTPLAPADSVIEVVRLNEKPYVEMTLSWLDRLGIIYERRGLEYFKIKGSQSYSAFKASVPGDFSSATFFLCAAAITNSEVTLKGLDMADPQGDKKVIDMLRAMGARIEVAPDGINVFGGAQLHGIELDLNDTPDALPAMAVVGCCASGRTILRNVPQARIKETDRIAVMRTALEKMGADIKEMPDGLIIHNSRLRGSKVSGWGDHRVVMSLAIAGFVADGKTEIDTAESIAVTFPNFASLMESLGARIATSAD